MQINTTSDALDNLNKKLGGADIEIEPSTNKVDALKKIYKTLGGTDDVKGLSTVYQVLEKITEVAEGGGGGDSDFTIANVTIWASGLNYYLPVLDEQDGINFINATMRSNSGNYQVPLYKGNAVFMPLDEGLAIDIAGNITPLVEGQAYLITGDGSIELND